MTRTEFGQENWKPSPLQDPAERLVEQLEKERRAAAEARHHYLAAFVAGCLTGSLGMFSAVAVAAMFLYI